MQANPHTLQADFDQGFVQGFQPVKRGGLHAADTTDAGGLRRRRQRWQGLLGVGLKLGRTALVFTQRNDQRQVKLVDARIAARAFIGTKSTLHIADHLGVPQRGDWIRHPAQADVFLRPFVFHQTRQAVSQAHVQAMEPAVKSGLAGAANRGLPFGATQGNAKRPVFFTGHHIGRFEKHRATAHVIEADRHLGQPFVRHRQLHLDVGRNITCTAEQNRAGNGVGVLGKTTKEFDTRNQPDPQAQVLLG
ncbi:hypothetical protein GALL_470370 [mine drainage metagenome]|uniref:Uncharacterized protein n=1 Tax=mine drainage metagenome TaxID=410659 RepID=A0A1J5Q5Y4_9ZZZZ